MKKKTKKNATDLTLRNNRARAKETKWLRDRVNMLWERIMDLESDVAGLKRKRSPRE